jgi:hypothetical protein
MFDRMEEVAALARAEFEALGTETARPSDDELTEDVRACQRAINALTAVQAVRMAQYAAREDVRHEDGTIGQRDFPVGHVSPFASAVIGPELGLGSRAAEERVGISARVVSTMPGTLRAMASGELDWHRARAVATELHDSSPEVVAEVEDRLFPAVLRDSAGEARRRCRRILQRVDSASLVERAKRAREGRGLQRWPGEPGVEEWHALLPAEQAATAWQAVDALARRYQREDRQHADAPATLEQARGDALLDLILGHASVQTSLVFTVPETFAQSGGRPGGGCEADRDGSAGVVHVPGVGALPWSGIGSLATSFATQISIASCDPANGALTGMATEVYRPPSALDRFVKDRDGTCRFPGCAAPAQRCDADHVVAWPAGPTDRTNLMSLCRRHHRTKQQPGWRVAMDADAVVTWTNPLGHSFTTYPVDHRQTVSTGPPPT